MLLSATISCVTDNPLVPAVLDSCYTSIFRKFSGRRQDERKRQVKAMHVTADMRSSDERLNSSACSRTTEAVCYGLSSKMSTTSCFMSIAAIYQLALLGREDAYAIAHSHTNYFIRHTA